ncbi:MAG: hypothetical protein ACKVTZ_00245 [Bacteroidia bacterium]
MNTTLRFIALIFLLITLASCGNSINHKQRELALKERELFLKERELELKEAEQSKQSEQPEVPIQEHEAIASTSINELSNIENLIGYWFTPHAATVNIQFNRNGRFEFNDYNARLEKEELLTGEFKLVNGTLTLMYDDRPKQHFKFYKGEEGDDNYYLKKSGYYFVKGENGD